MKLSPHQVRSVLGVNEQTLRYWKRMYPILAKRRGYGPCYSFSEVLVLLITKRLVDELGADVSKLMPMAEALFTACRESARLLTGAHQTMWIDLETMTLISQEKTPDDSAQLRIAIPVSALALELRARVLQALGDDEATQMLLPLGPTSMPSPTARRRAA
jgi:hypothetical protein